MYVIEDIDHYSDVLWTVDCLLLSFTRRGLFIVWAEAAYHACQHGSEKPERLTMSRRLVMFAAALSLTLVLVCAAGAQTASIIGSVVDSTGAVVTGAEITVRHVDTGAVRTVNSGDSGAYAVTNLQVGKYTFEVKKQNFAQFRVLDIVLNVDQVLTINATLKPGAVSESV